MAWQALSPECPKHDAKILVKKIYANSEGGVKLICYCPLCKDAPTDGWYAYEYSFQELVEIALSGDNQALILAQYEKQLKEEPHDCA